MKAVLGLFLVLVVISMVLVPHSFVNAKQSKADKRAEKTIEKALEKYVKDHYSQYCTVSATTKSNNVSKVLFDNACAPIIPPPPPPVTNQPPVPIITASKSIANVSDIINVSALASTDHDGRIVSYSWSGNGNINLTNTNGTTTSFTFPNIDKVSIGLTVKDDKNATAGAITQITKWTPPPPPPPPVPVVNTSKVCLVGDLSGSTVPNKMKDCTLKIGLGDLGYQSDLKWFKSLNFNKCVIGNHDAAEDGSSSIEKEALAYCGDHWSQKVGNATLIIGLNTNDGAGSISFVQSAIQDPKIKTVVLMSHKGGHVPPSSHHPAEASALYKQLEALIPSTIKLIEVYGHNHVMSSAPSVNWYQSGAGGKSHYSCGTDQVWTFCDNTHYGYLELTISNTDGTTAAKFIN